MTKPLKTAILFKSMKLDVRKCNAERKYAGELVFQTEGDLSLIEIPFVTFASPVKAELHYEILEDDSVEFTGRISFTLKGLCSRCLKETSQSYSQEVEGCYSPKQGEEEYFYRNGVVDLNDFIRDAVMQALPYSLLCEENCVPPEYKE